LVKIAGKKISGTLHDDLRTATITSYKISGTLYDDLSTATITSYKRAVFE
jgi:hypothetical protein